MKDNTDQYSVTIFEGTKGRGPIKRLSTQTISDPFIRTTIRPRGWRVALAVLLRRYELVVNVGGEAAAFRVVFRGDYTPDLPGPPVVMGLQGQA